MTDMPERIFAWPSDVTPPDKTALTGTWGVKRYPAEAVGFVSRAFHDAAIAAEREACAKVAEAWVARAMHLSPHGYELERELGRMVEIAGDEIRARKDTE